MRVALVEDFYVDGEHLPDIPRVDCDVDIENVEVGGPESQFDDLFVGVAVGPVVVRQAVSVRVEGAGVIPNSGLIVVAVCFRRAELRDDLDSDLSVGQGSSRVNLDDYDDLQSRVGLHHRHGDCICLG